MGEEYVSKIVLELQPRFDIFCFKLNKEKLLLDLVEVIVNYLEFMKINFLINKHLIQMISKKYFLENLIKKFSDEANMLNARI
jgi:hypothetical protein